MSELTDRIRGAVARRRSDLIDLTRDIVRFDSVTGREGPVQAYLAQRAARMGLAVDVFEPDLIALASHPAYHPVEGLDFAGRPNVIATLAGVGSGRSLILNGHVDTIPAEPVGEWHMDPFSGEVRDGRLFGRGSSDMKGGVAAMTMAVEVIRDLGIRLGGDLILQYVVDEELTGYGTLAAIQRGYRADAGICFETSDLCVQPACVGRLWFTMRLRGQAVSVTRHWEGINAIDKGIRFVQAFKDLESMRRIDRTHPLYPDNRFALPCGVFMFESGSFPSAVPDSAVLRGSLGLLPNEEVADVKAAVTEQVSLVCAGDPWLRHNPPVLEFKDVGADGAEIPTDHPIVEVVKTRYQAVTGRSAIVSGRIGGSDTRYLIKQAATPTVIFGPGVSTEMHAINESVPIANLEIATEVAALAIVDWCGLA